MTKAKTNRCDKQVSPAHFDLEKSLVWDREAASAHETAEPPDSRAIFSDSYRLWESSPEPCRAIGI
jgi:hypothetical protein